MIPVRGPITYFVARIAGFLILGWIAIFIASAQVAELGEGAISGETHGDTPAWFAGYPNTALANGHAKIWVAMPDSERGYNRAVRFDRAGMVLFVRTPDGHTCFGPLNDPADHVPSHHDHVAGTAGEFGITAPPGYATAAAGDSFLKIGVGLLRKLDGQPYDFRRPYPLINPGHWRFETSSDRIRMIHDLDSDSGWAYSYVTDVYLSPDGPGFVLQRSLTNRGQYTIRTGHYNHNFVLLDGQGVAPGYAVEFSWPHAPAVERDLGPSARFDGRRLTVERRLGDRAVWLPLVATQPVSDEAWFAEVSAPKGGAAIRLTHKPLPQQTVVFVREPAFSVEPSVAIDLEPGETFHWTAGYTLQRLDEPER